MAGAHRGAVRARLVVRPWDVATVPAGARGDRSVPPDRDRPAWSRRVVGARVSLGGGPRRGSGGIRRRARAAASVRAPRATRSAARSAQWYQQQRPADVCALGLDQHLARIHGRRPPRSPGGRQTGSSTPRNASTRSFAPEAGPEARALVMAARAATTLDALHGDLDAIAGWQNPGWLDIPIPTLVLTADSDTAAIQDFARQWVDRFAARHICVHPARRAHDADRTTRAHHGGHRRLARLADGHPGVTTRS